MGYLSLYSLCTTCYHFGPLLIWPVLWTDTRLHTWQHAWFKSINGPIHAHQNKAHHLYAMSTTQHAYIYISTHFR
jgi:hypothetical protein